MRICVVLIIAMSAFFEIQAQNVDIEKFNAAWKRHKTFSLELLDAFPEEKLSFRPSKESRSCAELMMHIAQSNYGFSAMIVTHPIPSPDVFDVNGKTKAQLQSVLADSFDFLLKHIGAIKDDSWNDSFNWGNRLEPTTTRTRSEILAILKEHAAHHRGQATVYLRVMGIEPPSFID